MFSNTEDVSFALLNALQGGGGGGNVGKVLRGAMRNAISRQYDSTRAVTRVSAVHAGKYDIVELPSSSSLAITFDKGMEGRGTFHETVDAIPREALELVLKGIHASDPESLRATMLAQLSPRVFWSLLKETSSSVSTTAEAAATGTGEHTVGRSTDAALQELLPTLDWTFLRRRKQTLSEKAQENLRQANSSREDEQDDDGNLEAAAEAVQAVEHAMEHLHNYDQTRRRNRAAEAAMARLGQQQPQGRGDDASEPQVAWSLVTPTELDEDELTECTGGDSDYASKLVNMGINNWRQLANAESSQIARELHVAESTVEVWLDRAQEESIEEVIVEICDGRVDVVEVLRAEANTGTPKDLGNWRCIPHMLFECASSSLQNLGVTVNDVALWCQRAHDVMEDYEWMSWYATPVE